MLPRRRCARAASDRSRGTQSRQAASWGRRGATLALAVVAILIAPEPLHAQGGLFCQPGQSPRFVFGFADLKAQIASAMGEPIVCEHPNSANGDTLQQTSTGLAFWRKSTNTPTFTDGWRHWAQTTRGLVYWEGDAVDPPGVTLPVGPSTGQPVPPAPPIAPAPVPPRAVFETVRGAGPNQQASATVRVEPPSGEIDCSIRYVTPAGTVSEAQGLGNRRTDPNGRVTWSWIIGARTGAGQGTLRVRCGDGEEVVTAIDIR